MRKNPKKTVLLYSTEDLNKFEKKKKKSELKDSDLKNMKTIIDKLKTSQRALYFRTSAIRQFESKKDKELYKSVITHPMDLSNITKKINNKKYNSFQEFYDDLNLIWDNAQLFNQSNSEVYEDAEYMRKYMEKIFKEKELDDKVKVKDKIFQELLKETDTDDKTKDKEKNIQDEENEDKEEDEEKEDNKDKDINLEQNLEINVNNDDFNNVLIGKKRKNKKNKDNNNANMDQKDNDKDEELNPIIDIKKTEDSNESIELKNNENNKSKKSSKIKERKNCCNISDTENNKDISNDKNDTNNDNYDTKDNKNISNEEMNKQIINNYLSTILENNKDNNKNNYSNEELKLNAMNNIAHNENNGNTPNIQKDDNDIKNNNDVNTSLDKDKINSLSSHIEYINDNQNEEILRKREEDIKKNEWSDEKIKTYAHKIAKKLDKLPDEDMFDLIEFVEGIRPQAVVDNGKYINIDMTKFIGDTYVQVWNFVENVLFKNSIFN